MSWLTWPGRIGVFLVWFTWQVAVSNVSVLRDNLTPSQNSTPGVARFSTRCRTDAELTGLAALITLTPGTLTLGTAAQASPAQARVLFVHGMYHPDAVSLTAELRTIEDRFLHAVRRQGEPS